MTSSIEPTINENVLPLTSTAELSFTQALTYLAISRKHQIYCNTQQVTSSQGHAMAREHQRRCSHHSWCLQPAYTSNTGDKTPQSAEGSIIRLTEGYPSVSQHVYLEACPTLMNARHYTVKDARKLGCRNWRTDAQDRGRWRGQGPPRAAEPMMMMMMTLYCTHYNFLINS